MKEDEEIRYLKNQMRELRTKMREIKVRISDIEKMKADNEKKSRIWKILEFRREDLRLHVLNFDFMTYTEVVKKMEEFVRDANYWHNQDSYSIIKNVDGKYMMEDGEELVKGIVID